MLVHWIGSDAEVDRAVDLRRRSVTAVLGHCASESRAPTEGSATGEAPFATLLRDLLDPLLGQVGKDMAEASNNEDRRAKSKCPFSARRYVSWAIWQRQVGS